MEKWMEKRSRNTLILNVIRHRQKTLKLLLLSPYREETYVTNLLKAVTVRGGCMHWIDLAQERDHWIELVKKVMNIRILLNVGKY
jgi:hypothetical protein